MKKICIKTNDVVKEAELRECATSEAIWNALPIKGRVNRWGDEIYFEIPVQAELADDARAEVAVGDLAYWPPGQAFCIFWGPTPASSGPEPQAASPVNVFGSITESPKGFGAVGDGEAILIERVDSK